MSFRGFSGRRLLMYSQLFVIMVLSSFPALVFSEILPASGFMNSMSGIEAAAKSQERTEARRAAVADQFREHYQFLLEYCLTSTSGQLKDKVLQLAGYNFYLAGMYSDDDLLKQMAVRLEANAETCR